MWNEDKDDRKKQGQKRREGTEKQRPGRRGEMGNLEAKRVTMRKRDVESIKHWASK